MVMTGFIPCTWIWIESGGYNGWAGHVVGMYEHDQHLTDPNHTQALGFLVPRCYMNMFMEVANLEMNKSWETKWRDDEEDYVWVLHSHPFNAYSSPTVAVLRHFSIQSIWVLWVPSLINYLK